MFTQPASIVPQPGNPQSLNRYSYGLNNPVKYVDPTGHEPWEPEEPNPSVIFVGGVGTSLNTEWGAWKDMIAQLGLEGGQYEFFDWSAGGRYFGAPSTERLLDDAANDLSSTLAGRKDVTLIGHSKGGDLILEYLAKVAEGRLPSNAAVKQAFILDSPTEAAGAAGARLPRHGLVDPNRSNVWDRMANLPARLAESTGAAMNVDVAMIANPRDPVSGPPVPGIPYFSFPSGSARFAGVPVLRWAEFGWTRGEVHGAVLSDPLVSEFISWYRRG